MKTTLWIKLCKGAVLVLTVSFGLAYCQSTKSTFTFGQKDDSLIIVHITHPTNYILLPIGEKADENQVRLDTGNAAGIDMDTRLAQTKVDYLVSLASPADTKVATLRIQKRSKDVLCWEETKLPDTFDTINTDKFRPVYHHTPLYGWMNDANGLVYKDGEYHLYCQYNPYGSKWGSMHWGHSVNKDLVYWEYSAPAIARDTLGHIFSGSSIVDQENMVGYGAGSILAYYTSASDKNGQIQCLACSKDNGRTSTKHEKDPVLRPSDGPKDFRDPKVFWYAPESKWAMAVSADKEMRPYDSHSLKDWDYLSSFGEGCGVQSCQFEYPDMVELPVDGDINYKKWVLIVNVNPGCYFGGSATQYSIGDSDGTKFTCDNQPNVIKWLNWGKGYYVTVCFSNTGDRAVTVPQVSSRQYYNIVPTRQFRSANALPRELGLYTQDNDIYLSVAPVAETKGLRKESKDVPSFTVDKDCHIESLLTDNEGAYELPPNIEAGKAEIIEFSLSNDKGEKVDTYFNLPEKKPVMGRTKGGIVDLGKNSSPHEIEAHDRQKTISINYIDDFALATWAPIQKENEYRLDVSVDKCSVEIFLDGGKVATTNLTFPTEPYNRMCSYSKDGIFAVDSFSVYRLGLWKGGFIFQQVFIKDMANCSSLV